MTTCSGKTIGKVKIGDMIARGGMAEVYSAEHIALNRKIAVKIMRILVDADPETRSRFDRDMEEALNEMRILSDQILFGVDTNGNELIEPIIGEGGGDTAYEHAYYMAEMPMLLGANRIPLPAVTESP
jgi:hypothetical protein